MSKPFLVSVNVQSILNFFFLHLHTSVSLLVYIYIYIYEYVCIGTHAYTTYLGNSKRTEMTIRGTEDQALSFFY